MKGYDVFFEEPGLVEKRTCQVCGTECIVERQKLGYTGWASAMGGKMIYHDYFYCPHHNQIWHTQALELLQAIEKMPSKRVAALMQQDLAELLAEYGCKL